MSTKLATIIADFTTSLATKLSIGGNSCTLQSITDDDGNTLPNGTYFFTINGDNAQKEHFVATLTSTALSAMSSISRQGVQSANAVREHRIGSSVSITNFAHIKYLNDLLDGTTDLNASVPLKYDGDPTLTLDAELATKKYADDLAIAGSPDMSLTVKGIGEEATAAEINAGTQAGGTSAELLVNPKYLKDSEYFTFRPTTDEKDALVGDLGSPSSADLFVTQTGLQKGAEIYAADAEANDTYVITLSPVPTAYFTGMVINFKANTANTGAATLNVNSLGAKAIKKHNDQDPVDGDIEAGQIVTLVYDGTDFQMQSQLAKTFSNKVSIDNSNITLPNNTAENTLVSFSLTGNSLSTNNAVRLRIYFIDMDVSAGRILTIRFKYGATTVVTNATTLTADNLNGYIECILYASGATNTQEGFVMFVSNITANGGSAVGTAAEDSTGALILAVTAQWSGTPGAATTFTSYLAELIS